MRHSTPEPGAFRSALLLHSPTRQVLWIPQILFYLLLFGLLTNIMLSIDEPVEAIVQAHLALLALAFRQLMVIHPRPKDVEAFEAVYNRDPVPMAVAKLVGKTKLSRPGYSVRRQANLPSTPDEIETAFPIVCLPLSNAAHCSSASIEGK